MRILIVSPHFPPDVSALARRVHDLARMWATLGHDVHVLTGMPGHPDGVLPLRYRGHVRVDEDVDGARVHRAWTWVTPNAGVLRRGLAFASYGLSALTVGQVALPRPDVVVASSPQFFAAVAGLLVGRLRGAPVVVEIRDLWPRSVWELGALPREHPVIGALEALEAWVYREADQLVVVSAPFRAHIEAVAPDRRSAEVAVITNGVDLDRFRPDVDGGPMRAVLGVPDDAPLVLYAGTHGMAHALETVVEAARAVPRARFVFVGSGARKPALQALARDVPNVSFHDPISADRMPEVYAAADVCLAPLRDLPVFRTVIPSKIFEIWGVGRPVVLAVRGESEAIVRDAGGGLVVPPEDPAALASAIQRLVDDPSLARALGAAGRRAVEADYDRRALAARYAALLADVAARGARATRRSPGPPWHRRAR